MVDLVSQYARAVSECLGNCQFGSRYTCCIADTVSIMHVVDEDARQKVHACGGTKSLFEWYMDMDFVVQLEALAALV